MRVVESLVDMGFSRKKAELAVSKTKSENLEIVMEWLLTHEEEDEDAEASTVGVAESASTPDATSEEPDATATSSTGSSEQQTAKSIVCDDCGKTFKTQTEVEFHAAKSGHEQFSESTEEKKPLSEEEKKEQLAKIEAKLKQRRLEREEREKLEALDREKKRIRSGKEMLEAKKKHDDMEIKKLVEQRKREKEEEKLARQRVRDQIEQDKLARKAKFSSPSENNEPETKVVQPTSTTTTPTARPSQSYTDVKIQVRLTNGATLVQTFGAKEPLSAVRLYIEMNRSDGQTPFLLMTNFPKIIFNEDDYEKPLDVLGLAPTAVLIVKKI